MFCVKVLVFHCMYTKAWKRKDAMILHFVYRALFKNLWSLTGTIKPALYILQKYGMNTCVWNDITEDKTVSNLLHKLLFTIQIYSETNLQ